MNKDKSVAGLLAAGASQSSTSVAVGSLQTLKTSEPAGAEQFGIKSVLNRQFESVQGAVSDQPAVKLEELTVTDPTPVDGGAAVAPPPPPVIPIPADLPDGSGVLSGDVWGGTLENPFSALQLEHFEESAGSNQLPPNYLVKYYKQAAQAYHIPWTVLAAINYIETDYGRDLNVSSAGAVGWMQFEPTTWLEYGDAVNLRGLVKKNAVPNPYQPSDAIYAAARLLVANGAHKNLAKAIFSYNHADWYVQEVLTVAQKITSHNVKARAHRRLMAMRQTASLLSGIAYTWGGGHLISNWVVSNGYDCSGFVSAILHSGGFLKDPVTTQTLPSQPGIETGAGHMVTIYDRTDAGGQDHVIIDLKGRWWESGGSTDAGGAGYVHQIHSLSASYLRSFNVVLHPKGM